jgi:hypothetical protein
LHFLCKKTIEIKNYITKGLIDDYFYTLDEPEFKKKLHLIAREYTDGLDTIDNPSPKNGKSGFHQVILYAFRLLYSENAVEDWVNEGLLNRRVRGRMLDLKEGSTLSESLKNSFKICDNVYYNE